LKKKFIFTHEKTKNRMHLFIICKAVKHRKFCPDLLFKYFFFWIVIELSLKPQSAIMNFRTISYFAFVMVFVPLVLSAKPKGRRPIPTNVSNFEFWTLIFNHAFQCQYGSEFLFGIRNSDILFRWRRMVLGINLGKIHRIFLIPRNFSSKNARDCNFKKKYS
jgi:hypothetical protein